MNTEKLAPLEFLPVKLFDRLMPFQKDGIQYAIKKMGCCLIADEMGLGKTLQALSVAYYFRHKWPLLIVVPASLKYPWVEEIEKWFPEIDPSSINVIINGSDFGEIATAQVTILSYGLLNRPSCKVVQEALVNQGFRFIIVDESHYMKNERAAITKYLVPLLQKAEHKILLTGTPALSRPRELFSQVDALHQGLFGSFFQFAHKYCAARFEWIAGKKRWRFDGASNLEELQKELTKHLMIRRLKNDVLTQLPPKRRQKIPFDVKDSTLKKEVDKIYGELGAELKKLRVSMSDVLKRDSEMHESGNLFKVKNLMSQMYRETAKVKIGPVRDYVKMLCENNGLKFLIFAYHHNMMDGIAEEMLDSGIKYIRIDGKTPSQERPALVHQFQQDEATRVGILSIKAAGVGLTLTAARVVIFAELDWTPGSLQQCEDRAHRIGQKETVHIHYLVAKGTLDEYVWSMLTRKTTVITTTLNGVTQTLQVEDGDKTQIDKLSNADVYIPPEKSEDVSFSHIFNSSQSNGQKSLLEFFSPRDGVNISNKGQKKKRREKEQIEKNDLDADIVIIDSESPVKSKKRKKPSSEIELTDSNDLGNLSAHDFRSPLVKSMRLAPKSDNERTLKCLPSCSEQAEAKWSCVTCTFLNHEFLTYCEMCSAVRPKESKEEDRKRSPQSSSVTISQDSCSFTSGNEDDMTNASMSEDLVISQSDGDMKTRGNESIYMRARKSVNPHEMSDSCSEATDDDTNETEWAVQNQRKKQRTGCLSNPLKSDYTSFCNDSIETIESIELFPDSSQSCIQNQSEDSDVLDEFHGRDQKYKTTDVDHENTLVEEQSPPKQSSDQNEQKTPECTRQGSGVLLRNLVNVTPTQTEEEIIYQESRAAIQLFPPKFPNASGVLRRVSWICGECSTTNDPNADGCNGCLAERPECAISDTEQRKVLCDQLELKKCKECDWENIGLDMKTCEMCFGPLCQINNEDNPNEDTVAGRDPKEKYHDLAAPEQEEPRSVNIDELQVYRQFQFLCSLNTDRIYLHDENGQPLNVNFLPIDVQMDNYGELPDVLLHPENLKLVKRFVREWNSLTATKRRLIVKSGIIFSNPVLSYREISSRTKTSKERYTAKSRGALLAMSKANEIGGSIRVVTRPISQGMNRQSKTKKENNYSDTANEELQSPTTDCCKVLNIVKGVVQTLDKHGNPLCIHCQKTYDTKLISKETLKENAWYTRFCSKKCMDEYWMKHNRQYSKQQVFETERGVCQSCKFNCQIFYERLRITKDLQKRAQLIQETHFSSLKAEMKQKMVKHPQIGQFWQADHIIPVAHGGGECDIDNLRTLCTVCHQKATAEQLRNKAATKRLEAAQFHMDIKSYFQPNI